MSVSLEREIKLRFDDPASARAAVAGAGATPVRARRLQDDRLLDTADGRLRGRGCVLRVRTDGDRIVLTFKGPVRPSRMKLREELETAVGDGPLILRLLEELGFRVWFRYQKYREEFSLHGAIVAIDETPVGTFAEVEGDDRGIAAACGAIGRGPADYLLDSYRGVYVRYCEDRGLPITDMLFGGF